MLKHQGEGEPNYKFKVEKVFRRTMECHVFETVHLKLLQEKGVNTTNLKTEYIRCLLPSLIVDGPTSMKVQSDILKEYAKAKVLNDEVISQNLEVDPKRQLIENEEGEQPQNEQVKKRRKVRIMRAPKRRLEEPSITPNHPPQGPKLPL